MILITETDYLTERSNKCSEEIISIEYLLITKFDLYRKLSILSSKDGFSDDLSVTPSNSKSHLSHPCGSSGWALHERWEDVEVKWLRIVNAKNCHLKFYNDNLNTASSLSAYDYIKAYKDISMCISRVVIVFQWSAIVE